MNRLMDKLFFVRRVTLFAQLDDSAQNEIAELAESATFTKGDWIFQQGQTGDAIYMLIRGQVALIRDGQEFKSLREGSSFGEMAVLDSGVRSAGARAASDCHVLRIRKHHFESIWELWPSLRLGILRQLVLLFQKDFAGSDRK